MTDQLPTLEPGVTYLDADAPGALYRVVGRHLRDERGPAYWVDAGNRAAPTVLYDHLPQRACRSLRVARAFTGYQHYELARELPALVEDAALVVAPNVGALYAEDDVPAVEADAMVEATLALLTGVGDAVDAPVLVTAPEPTYRETVAAAADRTLAAEGTRAGLRVEGPTTATDVYWQDWGFQTTIPYWVDLLGAAATIRPAERLDAAAAPAASPDDEPATLPGI